MDLSFSIVSQNTGSLHKACIATLLSFCNGIIVGESAPGSNLQSLGAYHSANADLANVQFNLTSIGATHNSSLFAQWSALNGTYFVHKQSPTTFDLYTDPAMQIPLNTSTLTSQYQTSSASYANIQANITLLGTGGDNRLFIRGYDFTLAESTLPGGSPSASLATLKMTAGRYQPTQRFPIRSANNTTSNDIIEIINGKYVRGQIDKGVLGGKSTGLILSIFNDYDYCWNCYYDYVKCCCDYYLNDNQCYDDSQSLLLLYSLVWL